MEGFEFKFDSKTYTVKLSDDLQYVTTILEWQKDEFDFQAYYRDLNMFFIFDSKFYGLKTGWLKDYNDPIKKFWVQQLDNGKT